MERVNKIIESREYKTYLKRTMDLERDRVFCRHDMEHFISVARIAYILTLERGLPLSKEIIYITAMLHDIGRFMEYESGIPHEKASGTLAEGILKNYGFSKEEIFTVLNAIVNHRNPNNEKNSLNEIIYLSDKASRSCFNCNAEKECSWSREKKNLQILI